MRNILLTWVETVLFLVFLGYLLKLSEGYSRLVFALWFVFGALLFLLTRLALRLFFRHLRKKGYNVRTVAVARAGDVGAAVAQQIVDNAWLGFELQGFYSDNQPPGYRPLPGIELNI